LSSADIDGPNEEVNKKFTCTATVAIKPVGSSSNVSGATVFITWKAADDTAAFPYDTKVKTADNGVATSVSKFMKNNAGCTFTVTRVTAAGYLMLDTLVTKTASP
jgi:hypothetical protein